MKLLKLFGVLVALAGLTVLAMVAGPSVFGAFDSRAIAQARQQLERVNRDFMLLEGRGSEIGLRIAGRADGVKVGEVGPGRAAAQAGGKAGGLITVFDG